MKFKKVSLGNIERCYSIGVVSTQGEQKILFASEAIDGPCYAYYGENFENREVVWEKAGGTMNIVNIPNTDGEFLATQKFFPGFQSSESEVVWGRYLENKWQIKKVLKIPYLHRFDLIEAEDKIYFVGATLCSSKKSREDWSDPGKIWVGELPQDLNEEFKVHEIKEGLIKNHGFWHGIYEGKKAIYTTCDSGVYVVIPPVKNKKWRVEKILDGKISDIAIYDLDDDGVNEIATIEPFHGNEINIYKFINGKYEKVYKYPSEIGFAHAIWAGSVYGESVLICGVRRINCELFYVIYNKETKKYESKIIENNVGPANINVINNKDKQILISANHTINEAALYLIQNN